MIRLLKLKHIKWLFQVRGLCQGFVAFILTTIIEDKIYLNYGITFEGMQYIIFFIAWFIVGEIFDMISRHFFHKKHK
ncbi:Hypothetical protein LUCI_4750 [Lucifera butyrica]|uniref:Uncharacterized protein n=1 Tax=Lucifera butyrica TaxID=1351585 RepID=A0A498RF76_9FIRM|nr:Hypothetical protein LUCI_4750 [Lucifera butyrica]